MKAARAYEVGMINRVVPRDQLEAEVEAMAERLGAIPPFGFKLAKQAMNMVDEGRGKRTVNDGIFAMHHLAHAHSQLTTGNLAGGLDPKKVKAG